MFSIFVVFGGGGGGGGGLPFLFLLTLTLFSEETQERGTRAVECVAICSCTFQIIECDRADISLHTDMHRLICPCLK